MKDNDDIKVRYPLAASYVKEAGYWVDIKFGHHLQSERHSRRCQELKAFFKILEVIAAREGKHFSPEMAMGDVRSFDKALVDMGVKGSKRVCYDLPEIAEICLMKARNLLEAGTIRAVPIPEKKGEDL